MLLPPIAIKEMTETTEGYPMGVYNWIILGRNGLLAPASVTFFKGDTLRPIKKLTETPAQH